MMVDEDGAQKDVAAAAATEKIGDSSAEQPAAGKIASDQDADKESSAVADADKPSSNRLPRSARKRKRQEERAEVFKAGRKERQREQRHRVSERKRARKQQHESASEEGGRGGEGGGEGGEDVADASEKDAAAANKEEKEKDSKDSQRRDPDAVREGRRLAKVAQQEDFKKLASEGTTVVMDLEWEQQLSEKEVKGVVQQVLYCYGANRKAKRPVRLVLSGVQAGSITSERLKKLSGFDTWLEVQTSERPYIELFPKERLVYLTADSEVNVRSFDKDKVYIIGGIVDRNRLKGKTREKADAQGIASEALPLSEHIEMGASSRVLTCNHVLDIIHAHQACGDWRRTFEKCVPGRKKFIENSESKQPEEKPPGGEVAGSPSAAKPAAKIGKSDGLGAKPDSAAKPQEEQGDEAPQKAPPSKCESAV